MPIPSFGQAASSSSVDCPAVRAAMEGNCRVLLLSKVWILRSRCILQVRLSSPRRSDDSSDEDGEQDERIRASKVRRAATCMATSFGIRCLVMQAAFAARWDRAKREGVRLHLAKLERELSATPTRPPFLPDCSCSCSRAPSVLACALCFLIGPPSAGGHAR